LSHTEIKRENSQQASYLDNLFLVTNVDFMFCSKSNFIENAKKEKLNISESLQVNLNN